MKVLIVIAATLLRASLTLAGEQNTPSKQMRQILAARFDGQVQLRTNGLKRLRYEDLKEIEKLANFEKYLVPHSGGSDLFQYEIWRSKDTGSYLVVKTGGEAGVLEVYGVGASPTGAPGFEPGGAGSRRQPPRLETNRTSAAAGSGR